MDLPQRKPNRLKDYDYSSPGIYFITICTKNMTELFWNTAFIPMFENAVNHPSVGAATGRPNPSPINESENQPLKTNPSNIIAAIHPDPTTNLPQGYHLSEYGKIVDVAIQNIPRVYPAVSVNKYVIMPNHVHLLLQIYPDASGQPMTAPTISTVVQRMKAYVTKEIGFSIWQKLFHDHILRNESEYPKIWEYIDQNPLKWEDDCFHPTNLQHP